jgi:hypothetical protein
MRPHTTRRSTVANAPKNPAHLRRCLYASANNPVAVKMKFAAVIGDMRPVGTAPNVPGFRTSHELIPELIPATNSASLAQTIANTIAANKHAGQRRAGRVSCRIRPTAMREKQSAVLGAIGMYLARTLARSDNPEIQPASLSKPRRIASNAQNSGSSRDSFVDLSTACQFAEASKRVQH